jgi:hypothetical protein
VREGGRGNGPLRSESCDIRVNRDRAAQPPALLVLGCCCLAVLRRLPSQPPERCHAEAAPRTCYGIIDLCQLLLSLVATAFIWLWIEKFIIFKN